MQKKKKKRKPSYLLISLCDPKISSKKYISAFLGTFKNKRKKTINKNKTENKQKTLSASQPLRTWGHWFLWKRVVNFQKHLGNMCVTHLFLIKHLKTPPLQVELQYQCEKVSFGYFIDKMLTFYIFIELENMPLLLI